MVRHWTCITQGMTDMESTSRRLKFVRPKSHALSFELSVIEGPDAGKTFMIESSTVILVGTSKLCALLLSDDTVAARQCSIEMNGDKLRIVDMGVHNGTRVNGVLAREAYLVGGELVRIGSTAIAIRRAEKSESKALPTSFGRLYGESAEMRVLYRRFAEAALRRSPLVIEGERGTGKRLLAEEIHAHGPWKDGPFVVVPRGDEIAPHVNSARGGTLYVEQASARCEIELPADVRIIFGTRVTHTNAFGGSIERITLPSLKNREGDVAVLARRFWTDLGGEGFLPDDFSARFGGHAWPGNVRELKIAVRDRLLHGADEVISDVYDIVPQAAPRADNRDAMESVIEADLTFVDARTEILAEFERRYVDRALERAGQNVARAAANSGIAHRYFQVLKSRRKPA
jgi:transcriptional regulator with PAS, ATPase and Fis domain